MKGGIKIKMKIKTIDINVKEWFDKINGNSYFAGEIFLNYGLKNVKCIFMPFQYGYGEHYQDEGFKAICEELKIKTDLRLYRYCEENNIILRTNKEENCLKKDLLIY